MKAFQKEVILKPHSRGFHLITSQILDQVPEIKEINIGWVQLFIKHTSASLTINENADPTVRMDLKVISIRWCLKGHLDYEHTYEGLDDMPAHIKASLMGASVQIPISNGQLNMGIWQGVYLGEHRNHGGPRRILVSILGT